MISGSFGDEDELFFEIELIAADSLQIPVEALFDTGFSWWLAINNQDLEALDWIYKTVGCQHWSMPPNLTGTYWLDIVCCLRPVSPKSL